MIFAWIMHPWFARDDPVLSAREKGSENEGSERERANERKTTNATTEVDDDDDARVAAGAAACDGALKPSASIKGHKKPLSHRRAKEEEALLVAFYLT